MEQLRHLTNVFFPILESGAHDREYLLAVPKSEIERDAPSRFRSLPLPEDFARLDDASIHGSAHPPFVGLFDWLPRCVDRPHRGVRQTIRTVQATGGPPGRVCRCSLRRPRKNRLPDVPVPALRRSPGEVRIPCEARRFFNLVGTLDRNDELEAIELRASGGSVRVSRWTS